MRVQVDHRKAGPGALLALAGLLGLSGPVLAGDNPACPGKGQCSFAGITPGCNDPDCCNLVCDLLPSCCQTSWSQDCVDLALANCDLVCPGDGDCFTPNGTPACDDPECCKFICQVVDPFCCDVSWDQECVDQAFSLCDNAPEDGCGVPGTGDCFQAGGNGSPYCDDAQCCETVCAADPFCCNTLWDGICANEALDLCACTPEDAPANDACTDALPIGLGMTKISNTCGQAQAPSHESCSDMFTTGLGIDIWYVFNASFTGDLVVSTCDLVPVTWDTQLAAYAGTDCGSLSDPPLACGDKSPCATGRVMTVPVEDGQSYLIRIGGTFDAPTGSGLVELSSDAFQPCSIDDEIPGEAIPEGEPCGDDENNGCFHNPNGSTCCIDQSGGGGMGCDNAGCEAAVCLSLPDCCDVIWDLACANRAHDVCALCPTDATAVSIGDVIQGTIWAEDGQRDTDWFELELAQAGPVTLTIQAEFAYVLGFYVGDCEDGALQSPIGGPADCVEASTVAELAAGTHRIFLSTDELAGLPCPTGGLTGNDYVLTIEGPAPPECPADTDGNGVVNVQDLVNLILDWGCVGAPGDCVGDIDGSGETDVNDLIMLVLGFGPCPK